MVTALSSFPKYTICALHRLCSGGGRYYSGRTIPFMDRSTPEWEAIGSVEASMAEAIVQGVGGKTAKVPVGIGEAMSKVCILINIYYIQ